MDILTSKQLRMAGWSAHSKTQKALTSRLDAPFGKSKRYGQAAGQVASKVEQP
jgi:hypothetical protein